MGHVSRMKRTNFPSEFFSIVVPILCFCTRDAHDAALCKMPYQAGRDNPRGRERRGASERARADNRKGYMAHIMRGGGRRREGGISLAAFQKPHSQCLLHSKYRLSHQATTAYYTGIPTYSDTVCNMASATLLLCHHERVSLKAGASLKKRIITALFFGC